MSNPGFEAPLSHVTEWSRPYSFLPAIESVFAPQIYSGPAPSLSQESNGISGIINSSSGGGDGSSSSSNGTAAALFLDCRQQADNAAAANNETVLASVEAEAAAETGCGGGRARQPSSLSDFGGSGGGSSPLHNPYPGEAGFLGLGHAQHSPAGQQYQQSPLGKPSVAGESCYAAHSHPGHAADLYEQTVGDSGMVVLPPPDLTMGPHGSLLGGRAGEEGIDENGEDDEDEREGGNEEEETGGNGGGGGGGSDAEEEEEEEEAVSVPQTTSERMAQRRKMKRFRLTHQQTRFLMSEFSKQPHPDAAHRECLSREIPGLSPRQVQVWFQNRRAKIKRLAADDRERVIKMRAVPDDFDNVQALHSPYGAVHGLGAPPLPSPVDYAAAPPPYADHPGQHLPQPPSYPQQQQQPQQQQHLASPSGLAAAFALGTAFPLAPAPHANARFGRVPTVPSSTISSSSSSSASSSSNSRSGVVAVDSDPRSRPLQLLQPLRPSMAWKGDAFDFSAMAGGRALQPQPAQAPSLPFLPSAPGPLHYDGSTATVRTPSFWGLQPQR